MKKEALRKLRALNATPAIIRIAKVNQINETDKNESWKKYKGNYKFLFRCQQLEGYLKVAVFIPKFVVKGDTKPMFEIFFNEDGEYITRYFNEKKEEKWSTSRIDNLQYIDRRLREYYWFKEYAWINPEGKRSVRSYLNSSETDVYKAILRHQENLYRKKLEEARKREVAPWDKDMALIPEIPKGFDKWVKKEGVAGHYIYYEYSRKGSNTGWCTYCEKEVPINKPKHNAYGKCKCCNRKIIFKAAGKAAAVWTDVKEVQLVQGIKNGIVVRNFLVRMKIPKKCYKNPIYFVDEVKRILFFRNESISKVYVWEDYKRTGNRWCNRNYIYNHYYHSYAKKIYKRNIQMLGKDALKHSGLPIVIKNSEYIDVEKYLRSEQGNPAIEKLVKLGMVNLAMEIMNARYDKDLFNEEASELSKMLKLDKNRLKRLKEMDGNIAHLRWLQEEKKQDTIFNTEMIAEFGKQRIIPPDLSFISHKMTYEKIYNYLSRQQKLIDESKSQLIGTWRDYLDMAKRAKMQIHKEQIYKPSNIKKAHDDLVEFFNGKEMEKEAEKWSKKYPKVDEVCKSLTKYEYSDGKYAIVSPKGIIDIIREGTILSHCVHTCDYYYDRMQRQETYLLFLRKTGTVDSPWYTLEVEPHGNIRQKRTTGDKQNKDLEAAVPFLKKWQKEIQKRITEEDKKLGKKSSELRKKEYAKLRKDGNRVWHGVLQGHLLADVLEADLMELEEIMQAI